LPVPGASIATVVSSAKIASLPSTCWPIASARGSSRAVVSANLRIPEHSVSGSGDIRSAIPTHPVTGARRR
jgi:hypothetical protein